jgi:hypothetical protein
MPKPLPLKYAGVCRGCRKPLGEGELGFWKADFGVRCEACGSWEAPVSRGVAGMPEQNVNGPDVVKRGAWRGGFLRARGAVTQHQGERGARGAPGFVPPALKKAPKKKK